MTDIDADKDKEDIAASIKGDGEAYRRLVVRYQNAVTTRMRRFSRDPAVLEELVQEVFIQAYQSLKGFKRRSPFFHWLQQIATRVGYRYWKNQYRKRAREADFDESGLDLAVDPETMSHFEAAETLFRLFAKMAPEDRLVLTLFYLDDCSINEIAIQSGWTQSNTKIRLFRARSKLKKLLKSEAV